MSDPCGMYLQVRGYMNMYVILDQSAWMKHKERRPSHTYAGCIHVPLREYKSRYLLSLFIRLDFIFSANFIHQNHRVAVLNRMFCPFFWGQVQSTVIIPYFVLKSCLYKRFILFDRLLSFNKREEIQNLAKTGSGNWMKGTFVYPVVLTLRGGQSPFISNFVQPERLEWF